MRCDRFCSSNSRIYHTDSDCRSGKKVASHNRTAEIGSRRHCWCCRSFEAREVAQAIETMLLETIEADAISSDHLSEVINLAGVLARLLQDD